MSPMPYYLGCPIWACAYWQGSLFTRHASRGQWLEQYSSVFNTVEGNSTFYALPPLDTVRQWSETVRPGFRFALKFPRAISHEKRLLDAGRETNAFLDVVQVMVDAGCVGPSFLQLPRGFSGHHLEDVEQYLQSLPRGLPYAVEVRHRDFFDGAAAGEELNKMLAELHIDRVIFDSRPLFSAPADDDAEAASQGRKPQLPIDRTVTGNHPLIRLVGRDDTSRVLPWIREWIPHVDAWIKNGLTPFIFTHAPDDRFAPELARLFHRELMQHNHAIEDLPPWPGESEPGAETQLELF